MSNIKSIFSFKKPILFYALVLITPLLFTTRTFEAFEFPKMIFVYFLGTTIIWLFAIKKIWQREKLNLPKAEVLLFLTIYLISTIFSSHPHTSVFGYYTRFNGGLISILVLAGLYTVLINSHNINEIKDLIKIACYPIIPVSVFAIYQHLSGETRVYSTLGQPNWLAAYVAMLLPITLFYAFKKDLIQKIFWSATFLVGFFGLWVTYSISGVLAMIISFVVFVYLNWNRLKQNKYWAGLLISLAIFIAVINPGIFKQKLNDVFIDIKKVYTASFIVNAQNKILQNNVSDPGFIRINLWKSTLDLSTNSFKNIMLGTGPETYPYAFQNFRPKQLNFSSEWDVVFNKPHNYYLEILSNIGFLGLITYLLIISKFFTKKNKFLIPSILAFLVSNFFGWPTVTTSIIFWIMLAHNYLLKESEL